MFYSCPIGRAKQRKYRRGRKTHSRGKETERGNPRENDKDKTTTLSDTNTAQGLTPQHLSQNQSSHLWEEE